MYEVKKDEEFITIKDGINTYFLKMSLRTDDSIREILKSWFGINSDLVYNEIKHAV